MHFVICMFTSLVIFAVSVLFTEIFPKWFKGLLILMGSYTTGYGVMILIRKISELTSAYKEPWLFPGVWIASGVSLVVIILVKIYLNKTLDKRLEKREARRAKQLAKWAEKDKAAA